jgi:hypothetical protein
MRCRQRRVKVSYLISMTHHRTAAPPVPARPVTGASVQLGFSPVMSSSSPAGTPCWTLCSPTICLDLFLPAHRSDLAETFKLTTCQCDEKRPCSACIRHDVKCSLLDNPPPAILQREAREREQRQREREQSESVTTASASPEGSKISFSTLDHVRSNQISRVLRPTDNDLDSLTVR